ncbi:hypothetical protein [Sphingomonas endolithica]|uniref:hypothetical protein n=1 Tax=Sphingomonas endolithica TaxID=2972485 RepID=UPI0021AEEE46|nr:hypothetical protein [Sphingomonas sp. ZFBP2030]
MSDKDELAKLTARINFLEKEMMRRAPDQQMNEMLILALWTWLFERNPDMNFEVISDELMKSIDKLPVPEAPTETANRIRAMLSNSLDDFLVNARKKLREAQERGESPRS